MGTDGLAHARPRLKHGHSHGGFSGPDGAVVVHTAHQVPRDQQDYLPFRHPHPWCCFCGEFLPLR